MAGQEQVSPERFEDFKSEVLRAISDLGSRISELTGEIKAYSQLSNMQGNQLTRHDADISNVKDITKKHEDKIDEHSLSIKELQTTMDNNQKNTNRNLTIITIVFAAITLILKLFDIG